MEVVGLTTTCVIGDLANVSTERCPEVPSREDSGSFSTMRSLSYQNCYGIDSMTELVTSVSEVLLPVLKLPQIPMKLLSYYHGP